MTPFSELISVIKRDITVHRVSFMFILREKMQMIIIDW